MSVLKICVLETVRTFHTLIFTVISFELYLICQYEVTRYNRNTENGKLMTYSRKVQVGNDQEKAQSEKDSHSKNRGGKN